MQFETLKTVADPGVFVWGWGRAGGRAVSPMICSPRLAKPYSPPPPQGRSVRTDWVIRDRLHFLSWWTIMATTRPITSFYQPVKSSEIENEKLKLNRRSWSHGMSDVWWAVVRTCTHALTPRPWQWRWRLCTIVVTKHKRRITCTRD